MINNIQNFNNKTFFLNSTQKEKTQIKKKKANLKNIVLPLGITSASAIAGASAANKYYLKFFNNAIKLGNSLVDEIREFKTSPNMKENTPIAQAAKYPYDIMTILFQKFDLLKEEPHLEKPNCLLFIGQNEKKAKNIIDWFAKTAKQNYFQLESILDDDFDLYEFLEKAEESYQKTGKWNLIYIKDMDKAINRNEVDDSFISAMKAIMCSTANDYHSTLIFSSTVPGELDHIAIESNRVTPINVDNIKTIEQLQQDAAQKRLSGYSYPTDYPISAINDMLSLVSNNKTRYKLYFDSTSKELNETREFIEKRLQTQDLQRYKQILKKACENAWYIV